jgi:SpoVK/Ycf46/Vps4 family AAA+-type ATPase
MDKWYGESNKLVEAIFSLATKLSPAIVFIDEIDAFLSARSSSDHESSALVKAQFLSNWDGFLQQKGARVVVVGATNRPAAVDRAILRRLTRTCHIGLPVRHAPFVVFLSSPSSFPSLAICPHSTHRHCAWPSRQDESQRQRILTVILREEKLEKQVTHARLAALTPGFSGSDLQELCRLAANEALRSGRTRPDPRVLPPLAWQDFEAAKQAVECATSEGVPLRPLAGSIGADDFEG